MSESTSSSSSHAITLEDLEALAGQIEQEDGAAREKFGRLIRAYSRILAIREPGTFRAMPLEYSDEDGHYDNSYPPEQEYKDRRGPRLIELASETAEHYATSRGFYYEFRVATTKPGLYVARDGALMGCQMTGTGTFGQFAAHPGDCHVMCEIEWVSLDLKDVTTEALSSAEAKLRAMAFPLSAQQ